MTIREKKEFLLKALYDKGITPEWHSPIKFFIDAGFEVSKDEIHEIALNLHGQGLIKYLEMTGGASITPDGIEYVEENILTGEFQSPSLDPFSQEEKVDLKNKLDQFAERLTKMEIGQQITYDDLMEEIKDLKSLLNTLGKKNWFEVFKGKMIDFGLGEISKKGIKLVSEIFKENQNLLGG